jgi:DNA-3-methyladenine glycosylase II
MLVLKQQDVLPEGDVGLARAIERKYGPAAALSNLSEAWKPYRTVACWYLWRSLGNEPLG